ncbi:hypothetical protein AAG570_014084 [Ranatra chinensis]|uniref:Uncharacterized protein n=1 Tax=Ranatra chinensis TaxID=642074 RepID=A0ABD0XUP8_9HEMI
MYSLLSIASSLSPNQFQDITIFSSAVVITHVMTDIGTPLKFGCNRRILRLSSPSPEHRRLEIQVPSDAETVPTTYRPVQAWLPVTNRAISSYKLTGGPSAGGGDDARRLKITAPLPAHFPSDFSPPLFAPLSETSGVRTVYDLA